MKNRATMILITVMLGLAGVLSPACYAAAGSALAEEGGEVKKDSGAGDSDKGILEKAGEFGDEMYEKADEAIDNFDGVSLRRSIREALKEMDEMGISPSVIAEKTFGIKTSPELRGQTPGDTLIKDAQNAVRKKTEGFFTVLWNGFLDTLESIITAGFSLAGGGKGTAR